MIFDDIPQHSMYFSMIFHYSMIEDSGNILQYRYLDTWWNSTIPWYSTIPPIQWQIQVTFYNRYSMIFHDIPQHSPTFHVFSHDIPLFHDSMIDSGNILQYRYLDTWWNSTIPWYSTIPPIPWQIQVTFYNRYSMIFHDIPQHSPTFHVFSMIFHYSMIQDSGNILQYRLDTWWNSTIPWYSTIPPIPWQIQVTFYRSFHWNDVKWHQWQVELQHLGDVFQSLRAKGIAELRLDAVAIRTVEATEALVKHFGRLGRSLEKPVFLKGPFEMFTVIVYLLCLKYSLSLNY